MNAVVTDEMMAQILEMRAAGVRVEDIAAKFYISKSTITYYTGVKGQERREKRERLKSGYKNGPMTPEKIERIRSLRGQGLGILQTAAAVGCSRETVNKYASQEEFPITGHETRYSPRRTITPDIIAEINELYAGGMLVQHIAKRIGISPKTVKKYAGISNVSRVPAGSKPDLTDREIERYLRREGVKMSSQYAIKGLEKKGMTKEDAKKAYWEWRYEYVRSFQGRQLKGSEGA